MKNIESCKNLLEFELKLQSNSSHNEITEIAGKSFIIAPCKNV